MYGYVNRAVTVFMGIYLVVILKTVNGLIIGENLANRLDIKSLIDYNIIEIKW